MNRQLLHNQPLFSNWIISEEQDGTLIARDPDILAGKGFRVILNESSLYFEASIKFEDFAFDLMDRTDKQISHSAPEWLNALLENDRHLKCKIYRSSVQVNFGQEKPESLWLKLERKKTASFTSINFIDCLVSFIYFLFPYQIQGEEEGGIVTDLVTSYERSSMNRTICLAYHGYSCKACKSDLGAIYGEVAKDFIHVHHLKPVSTSGIVRPDPVKDMIPLCPNCHGVAHLKNPPYTIQEIQTMISRNDAEIHLK